MTADAAQLLRWASWVLSLPVLLFSCGPFFSSAWRDLRARRIGMSDFINDFWSHFVTVIAVGSILACALLLWVTARSRGPSAGDNTTGHA